MYLNYNACKTFELKTTTSSKDCNINNSNCKVVLASSMLSCPFLPRENY